MVMVLALLTVASRGDDAADAPSVANSSTGSPTMSYTVSSYPAAIKLRAMGFPIIPSPTNPIFSAMLHPPSLSGLGPEHQVTKYVRRRACPETVYRKRIIPATRLLNLRHLPQPPNRDPTIMMIRGWSFSTAPLPSPRRQENSSSLTWQDHISSPSPLQGAPLNSSTC